jgi:hypothetical protein
MHLGGSVPYVTQFWRWPSQPDSPTWKVGGRKDLDVAERARERVLPGAGDNTLLRDPPDEH